MRNKEHYILATAEPPSLEAATQNSDSANPRKRKRAEALYQEQYQRASALRAGARSIPGVPIIYVKRSVMILEPMSTPSEKVRLGVERSKFKTGVEAALSAIDGAGGKRKREDDDEQSGKQRGFKKAKGPNPLSVKKPKKREKPRPEEQGKNSRTSDNHPEPGTITSGGAGSDGEKTTANATKTKRKRRHKSAKAGGDGDNTTETGRAEHPAADAVE